MNGTLLALTRGFSVILIVGILVGSLGGCDDSKTDESKAAAAKPASAAAPAAPANPADPKAEMARQLELLQAGDIEALKACFTERIRDKVTRQKMDEGVAGMKQKNITLDSMVASVETGEFEGKKTAKIKMDNGRTLTTLIQTDGRWLADTLWFD